MAVLGLTKAFYSERLAEVAPTTALDTLSRKHRLSYSLKTRTIPNFIGTVSADIKSAAIVLPNRFMTNTAKCDISGRARVKMSPRYNAKCLRIRQFHFFISPHLVGIALIGLAVYLGCSRGSPSAASKPQT